MFASCISPSQHILYWIISRGCRLYCGAENAAVLRGKHGGTTAFSPQQQQTRLHPMLIHFLWVYITLQKKPCLTWVWWGLSRKLCIDWPIRGSLYLSRSSRNCIPYDWSVCVSAGRWSINQSVRDVTFWKLMILPVCLIKGCSSFIPIKKTTQTDTTILARWKIALFNNTTGHRLYTKTAPLPILSNVIFTAASLYISSLILISRGWCSLFPLSETWLLYSAAHSINERTMDTVYDRLCVEKIKCTGIRETPIRYNNNS